MYTIQTPIMHLLTHPFMHLCIYNLFTHHPQDKEKRIYDLKKKNQELEKFKFVLDYKIKELKRQIVPRENEIADMKSQIKEMDQELEQYVFKK